MRISTKSKIALNAIIDIAAHTAKGRSISLPALCKRLGVSHSYLEQICSELKVAGLVQSYRGVGGGFSLAKNAESISVKDVVDATGEPQPLVAGPAMKVWVKLEGVIQGQMAQITLENILAVTAVNILPAKDLMRTRPLIKQEIDVVKTSVNKASSKDTAKEKLGPSSIFDLGSYLSRKNS